MLRHRFVSILFVLGLALVTQGCAEMFTTSAESMISKSDHEGLANYYARQAQELRLNADRAESLAGVYEQLVRSDPASDEGKRLAARAARSRAIAENYRKAAQEAETLASEHRSMQPRLKF